MREISGEPISVLISYWYFRKDKPLQKVIEAATEATRRGAAVRILVDSGAFSADSQGFDIPVADYAAWLREMQDVLAPWFVGAISLDVLRDPERSWQNWRDLHRRGLDTIPVSHLHDKTDVVDRYADADCDLIALGAMVGQSFPTKFRWAAWIHRHLRDHHPSVRTHGLGATSQRMVDVIPWWSVDSSSFGSGFRYGTARLYDPDKRKIVQVDVSGGVDTHRHGRLLRDVYGIDPAKIRKSNPDNRDLLLSAAARAVLLWQADLRKARPVPAPASQHDEGTHVHAVVGPGVSSNQAFPAYLKAAVGTHIHQVQDQGDLPHFLDKAADSTVNGPHINPVDTYADHIAEHIKKGSTP